jgi:hypothetical protein
MRPRAWNVTDERKPFRNLFVEGKYPTGTTRMMKRVEGPYSHDLWVDERGGSLGQPNWWMPLP